MNLKLQIISIFISLIYGVILYGFYSIFKKYTQNIKSIYKILSSFFFAMISTTIYFIIYNNINNGIIDKYFIFITIIIFLYLNYIRFTKKM